MKKQIAMMCIMFATSPLAFAQDNAKKGPSEAQLAHQERMKSCNAEAADKKGDERKKFMSTCLKGKRDLQQNRMTACNKEATGKKGEERKAFMKSCLSNKS